MAEDTHLLMSAMQVPRQQAVKTTDTDISRQSLKEADQNPGFPNMLEQ